MRNRFDRREFLRVVGSAGLAGCALNNPIAHAMASKRWAMVIDLRKCRNEKNCSRCISACHRAHNVPDFGNSKDEVKWIWKDSFESAFPEEVHPFQSNPQSSGPSILLCNHCDRPPCADVCPTGATWRRESDGIVMMDWHRCIGCRYCMAACPYGSRSFNWRDPRPFIKEITTAFPTRARGVVEKCNFCEERLSAGEMPVCVEACTAGAMIFGDLREAGSTLRQALRLNYTIRRKPGLGTQPQVYYIV